MNFQINLSSSRNDVFNVIIEKYVKFIDQLLCIKIAYIYVCIHASSIMLKTFTFVSLIHDTLSGT